MKNFLIILIYFGLILGAQAQTTISKTSNDNDTTLIYVKLNLATDLHCVKIVCTKYLIENNSNFIKFINVSKINDNDVNYLEINYSKIDVNWFIINRFDSFLRDREYY